MSDIASQESALCVWLDNYRYVESCRVSDDGQELSVFIDKCHFHDKDSILGMLHREFGLVFVKQERHGDCGYTLIVEPGETWEGER